ncbi:MAG: hypothetical protein K2G69_01845, partial [Muribaculaceae bacterium]|nr:hypothetical protein [Muribaculaceae bacterium]
VSTLVGGGNVVSPTKLEGEEWSEDGCVCSLYSGGGSWCISSWETGYLNVVVNLEDDTIKFRRTETSAVGEIEANGNQYNSMQPEYYNLQGAKVVPQNKGIYIEKRGEKVRKVIINK